MNYGNPAKKKKKTVIYWILGSLLIITSIIGAVYYVSQKDNKKQSQKREKEHKSVDIQQLQTQLNSVKSELNKSNSNQKSQLESKLTEIENKVKNLSSPDKANIKKLEQEIKEIKKKIEGDNPDNQKNNPPKDKPNDSPETPDNNSPPPPGKTPLPDNSQNQGYKYIATKINDNTYKYHITLSGTQLSFRDFIAFSKNKKTHFFQAFQGALKDANDKLGAYFWECPPVSQATLNKPFEFVCIKSEELNNMKQDFLSFIDQLNKINYGEFPHFISFANFSGDAILVIPSLHENGLPVLTNKNISTFTENAPLEKQKELWKEVAEKLSEELAKDDRPRWLNTHGLGVKYLHVRIDEKPKYYGDYEEYKKWK